MPTMEAPKVKAKGKKKMKFEITAGLHYQGNRTWKAGQIIASDLQLDKLFRQKFKRVPDEMPAHSGIVDFRYEMPGMEDVDLGTHKKDLKEYGGLTTDEANEGLEVEEMPVREEVTSNHQFLQGAKDVTEDFTYVKDEAVGLRVVQNGKHYGVISNDNPRELLNKDNPLKKSEVVPFVERYLDE